MTIDGEPVTGEAWMQVENPATEEFFGEAPECSSQLLDRAVMSAAGAFGKWAGLSEDRRREYLRDCGTVLSAHREAIARLLTAEQGKPLGKARAEVDLAANWFGHTSALRLPAEPLLADVASRITMARVPYGVVAAITPFNYPIILAVCKIAPALLAGNTVVLKPSPDTPLSTLTAVSALQEALPPGVLNVVSGDRLTGEALIRHPVVRKVSFTGSVEAGRAIAREAGDGLKHVTLELGGNDPAVILPGTDVAAIALELFWAAFENSGQFCGAVKRVYIPRPLEPELADALSAIARQVRVSDGDRPESELGPLTTRRQLDRVATLVGESRAAGARVLAGGHRLDRRGHFYAPTIVTDLPEGTRLEEEEQFGPVLPLIAYDAVETVVRRANASCYGLGASVWGDPQQGADVAMRLDAGTVWVNKHGDLRHEAPFGGFRSSGIGVEYGYWGLLEYTQLKVYNERRPPS